MVLRRFRRKVFSGNGERTASLVSAANRCILTEAIRVREIFEQFPELTQNLFLSRRRRNKDRVLIDD